MPKSVKLGQLAAFRPKSRDASRFRKNAPENRKLKVARNCRRKVRTRPERPSGLPTKLPDPFRAHFRGISMHLEISTKMQLIALCSSYGKCRFRPDIARYRSGSFVTSPEGRFGLVQAFPDSFSQLSIFGFRAHFAHFRYILRSDSKWSHLVRMTANSTTMTFHVLIVPIESSPRGVVSTP